MYNNIFQQNITCHKTLHMSLCLLQKFGQLLEVPSYCRTVIVQYVTVHLISCGSGLYANIAVSTVLLAVT